MKNVRTFILLCIYAAIAIAAPLHGLDLLSELEWQDNGSLHVEKVSGEGGTRIIFTLPRTAEPQKFINCTGRFDGIRDIGGFTSLKITARTISGQKIPIGVSFPCSGGYFQTQWSHGTTGAANRDFVFARDSFGKLRDPDLSQARGMILNFGIFGCDTSKADLTLEITEMELSGENDGFLIPRPAAGVIIDGAYQKDWGYENVLYLWTPPRFLSMREADGESGGEPAATRAEFSLMADSDKLYFLALVADDTPGGGISPQEPWNNDSVELFLSAGVPERAYSGQRPLRESGFQIIFDASQSGKPFLFGGTGTADDVKASLVQGDVTIGGKLQRGYVLEASMPLGLFPKGVPAKGGLIGWAVKLNDAAGSHQTLPASLTAPERSINGYGMAWLETRMKENFRGYAFGDAAAQPCWPERYNGGATPIWHEDFTQRRQLTSLSECLYLNDLWAVQGVRSAEQSPDSGEWRYAPLPLGISWATPAFRLDSRGRLADCHYTEIVGSQEDRRHCLWYERTVRIPPEWRGRDITFQIGHADGEVSVHINGKPAGILDASKKRSGRVNDLLHFGADNRIDLLYTGVINPRITPNGGFGITGDLAFVADSGNGSLKDIWVRQASGIDGGFRIEVRSDFPRCQDLELTLFSDDGTQIHQARIAPGQENTVFTGAVSNFPQWSGAHPRLCSARVRAFDRDGACVDEMSTRFGFRTFEVRDARFFLNGQPIRLRHTPIANDASEVYDPGFLDHARTLGFNAVYLHAGSAGNNQALFELLDRKGFLAFCPISDRLADEQTIEELRRYRNHPANIGYVSDPYGQFIFNGLGQTPFQVDDDFLPDSRKAREVGAFLKRRQALFAQGDPERLYIAQATGNLPGSMRMSHHYPTGALNLLDRMMFHYPWSRRAVKKLPLSIYEAGCRSIQEFDLRHCDDSFPVSGKKDLLTWRMLNFEAASRFIGDRAFDNWLEAEKLIFRASMRNYRMNGVDSFTPWGRLWHSMPAPRKGVFAEHDNRRLSWRHFTAPQSECYESQWMKMNSWYYRLRALPDRPWPAEYGQPGDRIEPTIFADIYEREMQPLFCMLAGPEDDLFSQDHNYYGGETVRRTVFAVNDDLGEHRFMAKAVLVADGRTIGENEFPVAIAPGEMRAMPVDFKLPEVSRRTPARLALLVDGRLADEYALTLFPPRNPAPAQMDDTLGILGDSQWLEKAGIRGRMLAANTTVPDGITRIIVGSNAFRGDFTAKCLEEFLSRGGQILMFEQDDATQFGHHARERRLEHAFIADASSPVVAGLRDEDLSFWRGRAQSVSDQSIPHPAYRYGIAPGVAIPHLTNRNLVAGRTVELPSYGTFRPIVTGGYDREEAMVLEARSGHGRLLLCMADLCTRYGIDPAATILADNLLAELARPAPPLHPAVRYSGDDDGRQFLESLGIAIDHASPVGVLGKDGHPGQLGDAGTIVRLPFSDAIPEAVAAKTHQIWCSACPRYWDGQFSGTLELLEDQRPGTDFPAAAGPAFAGLSACDFYFFELPELEQCRFTGDAAPGRLSPAGIAGEAQLGNRRLVVCGVDPRRIKSGESRGKAWRIWSVLFTNLGIASSHRIRFTDSQHDLSRHPWLLAIDPDGSGQAKGFAEGGCPPDRLRPIIPGIIWEAQGVTAPNPNLPDNAPGSAYDGYAWYFTTITFPKAPAGTLYFHVNGLRDIPTFQRTEQQSDLYLNGQKLPPPDGVYNGYLGGPGARLWQFDAGRFLHAGENRLALRVYNSQGAGGIDKLPVRIERPGINDNFLLPYEFRQSKYTNLFFWCW